MSGMYERDQAAALKVQELGDTIFIAESASTPFSRLLPRGDKPVAMLSSWPVANYRKEGFDGTVDGTDKTSYNKTPRSPVECYAQWFRSDGWLVGKLANLTATAGVPVGKEKAFQATKDAIALAKKIERALLSTMDTQAEAAPTTAYRTRGALSWLSTTAQSVKPVPAGFLPGTQYTGALADLTSSAFELLLEQCSIEKNAPVDLLGVVGIKLKRRMSAWAQRDTETSSTASALQNFNINASEKKLIQTVDVFEFDAGMVKTIPSWMIACDIDTGEATDYTTRSGVFVDTAMWELAFLQTPTTWENPDLGGGPRGWNDAVLIQKCLNPLGQFRVYSST